MKFSVLFWLGLARIAALGCLAGLFAPDARGGGGQWTLTGWNNLGMHCMDDDYSVFSILPPFNTVDAQLMDAAGKLVVDPAAASITVTYEAVADPDGSINTTSIGKTNFYDHVAGGYGAVLAPDAGLKGKSMPGAANTPQPMTWVAGMKVFEAEGIPITPRDNAGQHNPYPMMRLTAKNAAGTVLARADVVLPVSDEMDCRACHASGSGPAARPQAGWANDPNGKRDFRLNILRLHDEKAASAKYSQALAQFGYDPEGLHQTVVGAGRAVLCATCHASEALGTGGFPDVAPLTRAMHAKHAQVINPTNNLPLDSSLSRNSCYQCHPGSATRCLRGAMGSAVAADGTMSMQCQNCHGNMSTVGASTRTGWIQEPTCQACHTGDAVNHDAAGVRLLDVFDSPGHYRQPANTRFATNADQPAAGLSLYRFSAGHGGLQCSACHGSTHAEFPASHRNDNLHSLSLQGHVGVLVDCTACHATTPWTGNGGPHGMHSISNKWSQDHADLARSIGLVECQKCHGTDYRGTALSKAQGDRSFSTKFGTLTLKRGMEVGCYECHNGPNSSNASSRARLVVNDLARFLASTGPATVALNSTGTSPKLRVVQQPQHGTVGLTGTTATYFPDEGYTGPDYFTWLSADSSGYRDSLPATASLTVGAPDPLKDSDGDGLSDVVEYALGLDPSYPSTTAGPDYAWQTVGGQRYQTLGFRRGPLRPPDAAAAIVVSGDLAAWLPATVVTSTSGELIARDPVSQQAADRRFIRLQVTRPVPAP